VDCDGHSLDIRDDVADRANLFLGKAVHGREAAGTAARPLFMMRRGRSPVAGRHRAALIPPPRPR
jgi:hypothetical protein